MRIWKSSRGNGAFQVKRTVPLPGMSRERIEQVATRLRAIEPVAEARVGEGRLHLRYDASGVGFRDIERLLDEAGVQRAADFWSRCRAAWYRFLDANARSNALSRGGACCSRPPSPWRGNDDRDAGP